MGISEVMSRCFKNGIKVYPVLRNGRAKIRVEINGKARTLQKEVSGYKQINNALDATYRHYCKKLT